MVTVSEHRRNELNSIISMALSNMRTCRTQITEISKVAEDAVETMLTSTTLALTEASVNEAARIVTAKSVQACIVPCVNATDLELCT